MKQYANYRNTNQNKIGFQNNENIQNKVNLQHKADNPRQQAWKPKGAGNSGGAAPFPMGKEIEITFIDDDGRSKTTNAWVPLSN
ncbi:MAG: hypothetical protein Q8755_03460 [Candidatus Phytoplasma australasiaticum]|nr:hypothetical protein [Candidatus Phytoplasma australasiaticum]